MNKDLVEMIKRQTNVLFNNIQITFDEVRDIHIIPEFSDMTISKHVYHMLHSLDQWFINPFIFDEPDFHVDELNSLSVNSDKVLTKEELQSYFHSIAGELPEIIRTMLHVLFTKKVVRQSAVLMGNTITLTNGVQILQ